jgi:hypothetical protein
MGAMTITGAHVLLYSSEPDALREMLGGLLPGRAVDAGGGWLIFALPPAEVAVHPTDGAPSHELSFMCDDLTSTVEELRGKGVEVRGEPEDHGWGIATTLVLPGNLEVLLYEPRHATAQ